MAFTSNIQPHKVHHVFVGAHCMRPHCVTVEPKWDGLSIAYLQLFRFGHEGVCNTPLVCPAWA